MRRFVVIGLLGGIGSGKSTVARMFAEHGAVVLDADRIAHECLLREDVRNAIRARFGAGVFESDGRVDRARLAEVAFHDETSRQSLNAIVHPCVRREMRTRLDAAQQDVDVSMVVLDVPLLLESELDAWCNVRVFVDASRDERQRRVRIDRGWNDDELDRRENFQKTIDEKRAAADYTVVNEGGVEPTRIQVRAIVENLIQSPP